MTVGDAEKGQNTLKKTIERSVSLTVIKIWSSIKAPQSDVITARDFYRLGINPATVGRQ